MDHFCFEFSYIKLYSEIPITETKSFSEEDFEDNESTDFSTFPEFLGRFTQAKSIMNNNLAACVKVQNLGQGRVLMITESQTQNLSKL